MRIRNYTKFTSASPYVREAYLSDKDKIKVKREIEIHADRMYEVKKEDIHIFAYLYEYPRYFTEPLNALYRNAEEDSNYYYIVVYDVVFSGYTYTMYSILLYNKQSGCWKNIVLPPQWKNKNTKLNWLASSIYTRSLKTPTTLIYELSFSVATIFEHSYNELDTKPHRSA